MGHANGIAAYTGRVHYLVRSIGDFGIWLIGRLQHGDSARLSRGVDQRLAYHENVAVLDNTEDNRQQYGQDDGEFDNGRPSFVRGFFPIRMTSSSIFHFKKLGIVSP